MKQYENLPMDFADASLVMLAEDLGHGRIVSTDKRDFGVYRWKNTHPFQNLLDNLLTSIENLACLLCKWKIYFLFTVIIFCLCKNKDLMEWSTPLPNRPRNGP
jgi:hypothetical protein